MFNTEIVHSSQDEQLVYKDKEFALLRITVQSEKFEEVLRLRKEHYDDVSDPYDQTASIYLVYQNDLALGTARIIEARTSRLDFEEVLPFEIKPEFRNLVCSCSRLAITRRQRVPKTVTGLLLGIVGQDQIRKGVRFDLIACQEKLVLYYKRIGHQMLPHPVIVHPRTGKRCYLMILITTLRHTRFANQYFTGLPDRLEAEAITFLEQMTNDAPSFLLQKV